MSASNPNLPEQLVQSVLVQSSDLTGQTQIGGFDFNKSSSCVNYEALLDSYITSGFQAQNYGKAVLEIRRIEL